MFITNYPALKLENNLVITDLHLGISYEFKRDGFFVPSQLKKLSKQVNKLLDETKTKKLIIVGDFKHAVPGTPKKEKRELRQFVKKLKKDLIVIKGNHDSLIEKIVDVTVRKKMILDDFTLTHGHIKTKGEKFIIGHNHPLVMFKDKEKMTYRQRAWIISKNVIIMPAFNKLAGGVAMNKKDVELKGPIAKNIDLLNSKAHLLDGTHLGKIKDILVE